MVSLGVCAELNWLKESDPRPISGREFSQSEKEMTGQATSEQQQFHQQKGPVLLKQLIWHLWS